MDAVNYQDDRLIGIVERLEFVDALYGITKEEREVLDVIHGVKNINSEENEDDEWVVGY